MLWLGVHFPLLGLEIFQRRQHDHAKRACVLVEGNKVLLASPLARKAGIGLGSSLATAHSIASDLVYFNRDLEAEQHRLMILAEAAYRYTGHVSQQAPNALVMEVRGSLGLFGGLQRLHQRAKRLYRHLSHDVRIACAHTPLAALVLARAERGPELADFPEPDEVETQSLRVLEKVHLAYTDLSPKELERFANMGVFRIGQLMRLPRAELGKRFDSALLSYLARLTGEQPDPRKPIVPRETFTSSLHLLESISGKQTLLFPMQRLVTELTSWLAARQLGVEHMTWTFKTLGRAKARVYVKFAGARLDAKGILDVSKLTLEGAELPEEIMSVTLAATRVAPLTARSADLFGSPRANANGANVSDATVLIDKLIARLGGESLQGICVVDDHRPEHAWEPCSIASKRPPAVELPRRKRPMWLFEPPRAVNPSRFEILSGPERIETGWWESGFARDYYIAVDHDGAQCWLYNDFAQANWFLHGYFS